MLKRNLIANYLGQGWKALMSLAFIPLYIKYLGIESYGLIGIFALLQSWLCLLDMGMRPTLSREMARATGGAHSAKSIRDILRSIEILTVIVAGIIGIGIWAASVWLANDWLRAEKLPVETVAQAFTIMGVVSALSFIEGIYSSSLLGLQRQVLMNSLSSATATLRGFGAVGILMWVSPTLDAFFIWQGCVSILSVIILGRATYLALPQSTISGCFSIVELQPIWRYAIGMLGINLLSLALMQVDKILLSKLISLSEYGYYTMAAVAAGVLNMIVGPINQAWFPRLSELFVLNDQAGLIKTYHQGAQLVSVFMGSTGIVLIVFAAPILQIWTGDNQVAQRVAPLFSVLVLGNLLNGLMWIPYHTQLAHGWTGLNIRINLVSVLLIVPAILWAVPHYGAIGAAWIWVSLNTGYLLIGVHFMYRKIMKGEKWIWYTDDLLSPLLAATFGTLLVHWIAPPTPRPLGAFGMLIFATILSVTLATLAAPLLRQQLRTYIQILFSR
ncbi:MAG: oligosaccharide flippase family protein [Methylococcaceae bacterium]